MTSVESYQRFVELVSHRLEPDADVEHIIEATLLIMGEHLLDVPEQVTSDPLPPPLARTLHHHELENDFDLRSLCEHAARHARTSGARAAGRRWADDKADVLDGDMPANAWPDMWEPGMDGELEESLPRDEAHHAAVERWAELVVHAREAEGLDAEEHDAEVAALKLCEAIVRDLPQGLMLGRDGPRAYLLDRMTGEELTIGSLEHAWKVVETWRERSH